MNITICIESKDNEISVYEKSVGIRYAVPTLSAALTLTYELMSSKEPTAWQQVKAWFSR